MKTIMVLLLTVFALPAMAQSNTSENATNNIEKTGRIVLGNRDNSPRRIEKATLVSFNVRQDMYPYTHKPLYAMPTRDVNDAISLMAGVYQQRRGGGIRVLGGREIDNLYVVDGVVLLRH